MPIYCKADPIKGSVTDSKYKDQIEFESLSFGVTRAFTHTAGGTRDKIADHPDFTEISWSKRTDNASVDLFSFCAWGKEIDKVEISLVGTQKEKTEEYIKIELENVLIATYQAAGGGGDLPSESGSFNFTKITYTFNSRDEKGTVTPKKAGHDLKLNKKV
jgi:type VI secretion system secreted protein Hcp